MEEDILKLRQEIEKIQSRNARKEAEKAWEISVVRIFSISITTYTVAALVFWLIQVKNPFLNALIPTIGFVFSTFSIPWIKERWVNRHLQSQKNT